MLHGGGAKKKRLWRGTTGTSGRQCGRRGGRGRSAATGELWAEEGEDDDDDDDGNEAEHGRVEAHGAPPLTAMERGGLRVEVRRLVFELRGVVVNVLRQVNVAQHAPQIGLHLALDLVEIAPDALEAVDLRRVVVLLGQVLQQALGDLVQPVDGTGQRRGAVFFKLGDELANHLEHEPLRVVLG